MLENQQNYTFMQPEAELSWEECGVQGEYYKKEILII